jgi:hypothetical protein
VPGLGVGEMMCIAMVFHHHRILDDKYIQRGRNTNKKQDSANSGINPRLLVKIMVFFSGFEQFIGSFPDPLVPVCPTLPYRCHPFPDQCIFLMVSSCLEHVHDCQECRLIGRFRPVPDLSHHCDPQMHQLHLPAGRTFLPCKVQPDQAECNGDVPDWSPRMLGDEFRILLCNRGALELGK